MKNILLPTDFSDNSIHAINHALKMFSKDSCHFYLLHSYESILENMAQMQISAAEIGVEETAKKASKERLQEILHKVTTLYKNSKHTFEIISGSGELTKEIKKLVDQKQIDYVVMGTKGTTGSKEVLYGSNTVDVFKKATCPVLVIPKKAEYKTVKDILFATDYGIDFQAKSLKPLQAIAKEQGAKVHILHVSLSNGLTAKQQTNRLKLNEYLENSNHDFHDVSNDDVQPAIVEFQEQHPVDMLVMINNKHSFFENLFFASRINKIGFHIGIPFLVIPSYL
ncbi:universal stress protein [Bizionia myxarmorum]|uniref:Universal stress protein n=1 Tax=Bizionia myxarmorum TaxID=291186 RepID=A0A5D0R9Y3_9FLAO|nr:universal stress protein [Bizionia myxarmorum]TYB78297.1 universal stress protein [Bizionia myxarmorum]